MPKNKQKEIAAKIALEYKRAQDYKQQAQSKWQEVKELIERLIYEATGVKSSAKLSKRKRNKTTLP